MAGLSKNPIKRAKQLANLNQYKPGDKGHSNAGRPPGSPSISDALRRRLTRERGDAIAERILVSLETGEINTSMLREVLDRLEGKVPQAVEHSGKAGAPIEFVEVRQVGGGTGNG